MAAKRSLSTDSQGADLPPPKKTSLLQAPIDIGQATGEEDLSIKTLQVQNRKLSERLQERNHRADQLEHRLLQVERRRSEELHVMAVLKRLLGSLHQQTRALLAPLEGAAPLKPVLEEEWERLAHGSAQEREEVVSGVLGGVATGLELLCREQLAPAVGQACGEELAGRLRDLARARAEPQQADLLDQLSTLRDRCDEVEGCTVDLRFDLQKSQSRCDRLELQLAQALERLEHSQAMPPSIPSSPSSSTKAPKGTTPSDEGEEVQAEVAEWRALAESRLAEVEGLGRRLQEASAQLERQGLDKQLPLDSSVRETAVYKELQAQYSLVCIENSRLRAHAEELRRLLSTAKPQLIQKLEEIRSEELKYDQEVREELSHLEAALASVKHDYEILRVEFEKTLASNEQAAPIAKELQVTVESLQKTIQQLKSEVNRYKTRAHKSEQLLTKQQEEKARASSEEQGGGAAEQTQVELAPAEELAQLQEKLKALEEANRELAIALESHKSSPQDLREKAELISAEKKACQQAEDLKKKCEEMKKDYEKRKERIREEASRKAKAFAEDNRHLHKELLAKKHEAQALMSEMECTTQAFEEAQEQNIRLLQQLKEKDDANFKLMSERIKSSSIHKLMQEENALLQSQVNSLSTENTRLMGQVALLEEREKTSEASVKALEREMSLKLQTMDLHKSKAVEGVLAVQEAEVRLGESENKLQAAQKALQAKAEQCEREVNNLHRVQEEVGSLKRRVEKYKSRDWSVGGGDEVLLEEIKTYKVKLNCPCCSTRRKDTVLTKCFHVFCAECIRSRYDSRLRKCPKCGAAFGANDFHKIYLS